jgi:hypothetical protein
MAWTKPFDKMTPAEKKAARWEDENLIENYGYFIKKPARLDSVVDNVFRRGYDAARVSPRTTTKNGKLYRQVFGGAINGPGDRAPGKVNWYSVGYVRAGRAKPGTTPRDPIRSMAKDYRVTEEFLKRQLMMK